MSNLPHPLADAAAGDFFYPGSPTVTVADAPGAGGSRAVEFGEDGYSSAVNRGHYAILKNVEYIQSRMETKIAKPEFTAWVPSGGSGSGYTFTGVDVFVGDATYLPESQAVRDGLISVLDANYQDLLDASGNKVVVKTIRESGDSLSIVGDVLGSGGDENGFYTAPVIHFQTVHPTTGVVVNASYTIPNGTGVILVHGISGTLDTLATLGSEHLMRDALVKAVIRGASKVDAGVFLTDGSRFMIDDFDANGHDLINVNQVLSASPMTIRAFDELHLVGDTELDLKDQHLSSAVPLSQTGVTALNGYYTSLVGQLNSRTALDVSHGNRSINQTGSVVFTDGTGDIAYPSLSVIIGGEQRTIAAGNLTASNSANVHCVVVGSTGTVSEKEFDTLSETDIIITAHVWNGASFTLKLDVRSKLDYRTRTLEITCGAIGDFSEVQFREAVELASRYSTVAVGTSIVRVLGLVGVPTTDVKINIRGPVQILGYGPESSIIVNDPTAGDATDLFECNGHRVIFKDLSLLCASAAQLGDLGCFADAGSGSLFSNLKFGIYPGGGVVGFGAAFVWRNATNNVTVEKCEAVGLTNAFAWGTTVDLTTGVYLTSSTFRDCKISGWGSGASVGMALSGAGNKVINCDIIGETLTPLDDYGVVIGHGGLVSGCKIQLQAAGGVGRGVYYNPDDGLPDITQAAIVENTAFVLMSDGIWSNSDGSGTMRWGLEVKSCSFVTVDAPVRLNALDDFIPAQSYFRFVGNYVHTTTSEAVHIAPIGTSSLGCWIANNHFSGIDGDGIVMGTFAGGVIEGNAFEGYGDSGTGKTAIWLGISALSTEVRGNTIGGVGNPASSIMIRCARAATIAENHLSSTTAGTGISLEAFSDGSSVRGNAISSVTGYGVDVVSHNNRIDGNRLFSLPEASVGVRVTGGTSNNILNNSFGGPAALGAMDGAGVLITGSGDNAHNNRINNNVFMNVAGVNAGYVIVVVSVTGSSKNTQINGNLLDSCGDDSIALSGGTQSLISSGSVGSQIHGNKIVSLKGYGTGDTTNAIFLSEGGSVCNNEIYHDFTIVKSSLPVSVNMRGISLTGDGILCSNNHMFFTGTAGAGEQDPETVRGILSTGDQCVFSNNHVTAYDTTETPKSNLGFYLSGTGGALIGNFSESAASAFNGDGTMSVGNFTSGSANTFSALSANVIPDHVTNCSALADTLFDQFNP